MKNNTRSIVLLGLLIGLNIVFSRFISISAWNFKIGFTFLTVLVAAYILGIPGACLVAGLGDFIGALLFPIGAYNPGFTFSAILTGLIYGAFFKDDFDNKKTLMLLLRVFPANPFRFAESKKAFQMTEAICSLR